ncbi:MAG: hypothetical protein IJR14_11680 [Synergistaceae bacterium]|nr:hypothetical protein [Synergistaceae bacterium]
MKELIVSPDFTMEDIRNIRDWHAERRSLIGKEAFNAEIAAKAQKVRAEIEALRREREAG